MKNVQLTGKLKKFYGDHYFDKEKITSRIMSDDEALSYESNPNFTVVSITKDSNENAGEYDNDDTNEDPDSNLNDDSEDVNEDDKAEQKEVIIKKKKKK